jgi:hypothetical protein
VREAEADEWESGRLERAKGGGRREGVGGRKIKDGERGRGNGRDKGRDGETERREEEGEGEGERERGRYRETLRENEGLSERMNPSGRSVGAGGRAGLERSEPTGRQRLGDVIWGGGGRAEVFGSAWSGAWGVIGDAIGQSGVY